MRQRQVLVRGSVVITTVAILVTLLLASGVGAVTDRSPEPVEVRIVLPGDTLWEIAAEVGGSQADVRRVVEDIRRLNDLEGSLIRPGDRLVVPRS